VSSPSATDVTELKSRISDGGKIFSRATLRAMNLLGYVSNARETIEATMPSGKGVLQMKYADLVQALLNDPKTIRIFKDPAAMPKRENYVECVEDMTQRSMVSAGNLVSAACLVFAHAVFDATLFDYCKVTALCAPKDWLDVVKKRQVSISKVQELSTLGILIETVDSKLDELERESILKKADILHQIIKPDGKELLSDYQYSKARLEKIDCKRHEAVHRLQFETAFSSLEETIAYLCRTVFYFAVLLNVRYGLKIDPNVDVKKASELRLKRSRAH
jgi:hypothetical protein